MIKKKNNLKIVKYLKLWKNDKRKEEFKNCKIFKTNKCKNLKKW